MLGLQGPLVVEQPFSLQLKLRRRGDMPMRSVAIQAGASCLRLPARASASRSVECDVAWASASCGLTSTRSCVEDSALSGPLQSKLWPEGPLTHCARSTARYFKEGLGFRVQDPL